MQAVRERAGLIDLTSFGKIAVGGPGATALLQRVCANDIDRPPGSIVYGQFLDVRGGMLADVTVTRLAEERYRVVTGAGYLAGDLGWLRANVRDDEPPVTLADESADWACFGLWGPASRDVLGSVADDDVSDAALPSRRAMTIGIGGARALAARLSYVGELGWELYVPPDWAVAVWDRLLESGRSVDLAPVGYRALDALRMEKGYRYYGTDLTMLETPDEAGLGGFVRLAKGSFIGSAAIARQREAAPSGPSRRLRTVVIGHDPAYLPIYGGEAVRRNGEVVGRLRSATYGFGVSRTVGYVYLPSDMQPGDAMSVDVLGARVPAAVTADVLHDPARARMRG